MPRQKKDGVYINYYIRKDVKDKLDQYCDDVGQTATTAIERILDEHLTDYFANKSVHKPKQNGIVRKSSNPVQHKMSAKEKAEFSDMSQIEWVPGDPFND